MWFTSSTKTVCTFKNPNEFWNLLFVDTLVYFFIDMFAQSRSWPCNVKVRSPEEHSVQYLYVFFNKTGRRSKAEPGALKERARGSILSDIQVARAKVRVSLVSAIYYVIHFFQFCIYLSNVIWEFSELYQPWQRNMIPRKRWIEIWCSISSVLDIFSES